ncbi:hypothetical protein JCM33374_g6650 [Metschnikowia sp. JCM 33374]|nr:hypothetical protein JCM33374_g6650 [Metschnikowia sp. JCM 33374]
MTKCIPNINESITTEKDRGEIASVEEDRVSAATRKTSEGTGHATSKVPNREDNLGYSELAGNIQCPVMLLIGTQTAHITVIFKE